VRIKASMKLNPEQQRAIDARGLVFVSAGAAPARRRSSSSVSPAQCATRDRRRVDPRDQRTPRRRRASCEPDRAGLVERGRPDLARELDGAWISTIHGFCNRLLRSHPFAAGVDPRFRVLDESQGRVLRGEAFALH